MNLSTFMEYTHTQHTTYTHAFVVIKNLNSTLLQVMALFYIYMRPGSYKIPKGTNLRNFELEWIIKANTNTHITNTSISVALLQRSDSALNHTDGYWKLWFSRGHDDGRDQRPKTTRVTQAKGCCVPLPRSLSTEHECYCTSAEGQTAQTHSYSMPIQRENDPRSLKDTKRDDGRPQAKVQHCCFNCSDRVT